MSNENIQMTATDLLGSILEEIYKSKIAQKEHIAAGSPGYGLVPSEIFTGIATSMGDNYAVITMKDGRRFSIEVKQVEG